MPDVKGRFLSAGKGVIRFVIPNNPITGLLFGDTEAIRITEEDLKELKEIIICQ